MWHFRIIKKKTKEGVLWGVVEYYPEYKSWTEESMVGWFETEKEVRDYVKNMYKDISKRGVLEWEE